MRTALLSCLLLLGLAACGEETEEGGLQPWRYATVSGLGEASGVTLFGEDLVLVCGNNDRDIYTVSRAGLRDGDALRARKLAVQIKPDALLMGTEPFALQRYTLDMLWKVPVDFQAVAAQQPHYLYVAERNRRLILWGRLTRRADGALSTIRFDHVSIAPGGERSAADAGDWRDKGSGARGLVAVERSARMEDLWLVDAGAPGEPIRIRRLDRYGSNYGGIRARHTFEGSPDVQAMSWENGRLVMLLGAGRGRLVPLKPPPPGKLDSVNMGPGVPGPVVPAGKRWAGMAHAADGTVFLVSSGSPATLGWRRP